MVNSSPEVLNLIFQLFVLCPKPNIFPSECLLFQTGSRCFKTVRIDQRGSGMFVWMFGSVCRVALFQMFMSLAFILCGYYTIFLTICPQAIQTTLVMIANAAKLQFESGGRARLADLWRQLRQESAASHPLWESFAGEGAILAAGGQLDVRRVIEAEGAA